MGCRRRPGSILGKRAPDRLLKLLIGDAGECIPEVGERSRLRGPTSVLARQALKVFHRDNHRDGQPVLLEEDKLSVVDDAAEDSRGAICRSDEWIVSIAEEAMARFLREPPRRYFIFAMMSSIDDFSSLARVRFSRMRSSTEAILATSPSSGRVASDAFHRSTVDSS
jgi:PleD family two-component response regulator